MISMSGVRKAFGDNEVLSDINFTIKGGERISLVGPGGSGKSTVLKVLLGLLPPDAGKVEVMGVDMIEAKEHEKQSVLRRVGMAFQQGALFDFMTVKENLAFAMENMTDLDAKAMAERSKQLLLGVKLGRTESMYPYELSGGMQRRVGIARALCTDPMVAIFDEPTSGLDPVTSTIILNMILELSSAEGAYSSDERSQMVVTSNVEIGIRFAERLLVLHEGRIVADGPWQDLLMDGPEWVRHFLGVRFIGLDREYAEELRLPAAFISQHW